jgi:2-polyprenyl-6-methoxyphenol hydroxylase-like FAD-dependent oxidoreductase
MMFDPCEVLVVGAGPTGLMAAGLLARSGVVVRIVEERAEASRESRAFAIQARTMELFQHLGLVEKLLDHGVVNSGVEFHVRGQHVGGLDFDAAASPDTPYPFIFLLPQSHTEAILVEDLAAQGVRIERGSRVTAVAQDADGVATEISGPHGTAEIRSRYLLGCDGAHSVVRRAQGFRFDGAKYAQTFLLADCRVEWPFDHARFRVFMNGASTGLFLPLERQRRSRVMATDLAAHAEDTAASPMDLPELQAAFREAAGIEATLSEPVWATRYRVHHRGVDTYRKGRVFLAGDAAHIHSPAGGQGMNTGLQDAANLAWKLAAVLRGAAGQQLLGSYDDERRPVGEQVVATSDRMFSLAAGQTGWEATLRDWLARPAAAVLSGSKSVQHRAFRTLSELDIAYPGHDTAPSLHGGPAVGTRAPNAEVARHRDVFDLLAGYRWTVLAFSRTPLEHDAADRIVAALEAVKSARKGGEGPPPAVHLIARSVAGRHECSVFTSSAAAFDAYGVREQAMYLVRPDGYVAWRGAGIDAAECRRALAAFGL